MKKVLFLMFLLFLFAFGTAGFAQVRIGGDGNPNAAAVLDLNADNTATPAGNKGALALPRVNLTSTTMKLNNATPVNGMLVYHTGAALDGTGVYVWLTDKWVKASTGVVAYSGSVSVVLDGSSFERENLTGDVTADRNSNVTTIANGAVTSAKIAAGAVTSELIADGAVDDTKLADGSVTHEKIATMAAEPGDVLTFNGSTWSPSPPSGRFGVAASGNYVLVQRAASVAWSWPPGYYVVPIACGATTTPGVLTAVAEPAQVSSWTVARANLGYVQYICRDSQPCSCICHIF